MAIKTFQNVKLKVTFKEYTKDTYSALESGENLAHSLGKIKYWMENWNSFVDTYEFLDGTAESGVATWQYKKNGGTPTPVTVYGVPTLTDGKIPADFLPSYVDDVVDAYYDADTGIMYEDAEHTKPLTGEKGKIYLDVSQEPAVAYRWSGSEYFGIASAKIPRFAVNTDGAVPGPTQTDVDEGYVLKADGTWGKPTEMVGATASTDGESGIVPAPSKNGFTEYTTVNNQFLRGDGVWSSAPVIEQDTLELNCVPDAS